jgi:hypothetical protein
MGMVKLQMGQLGPGREVNANVHWGQMKNSSSSNIEKEVYKGILKKNKKQQTQL